MNLTQTIPLKTFVALAAVGIAVVCGVATLLDRTGRMPVASSSNTAPAAFDVPALVGLDLKGVVSALGTPTKANAPTSRRGVMVWTKDGQTLRVTYLVPSTKIDHFFLSAGGPTSDLGRLQSAVNVSGDTSRYTVEGVAALGYPGQYTGLRVTPR